jgi:tetrahydromethanopterin S-methyltransferase subunit E
VAGGSGEGVVVGEPRWHMASAVVAAIVLTILMPDDVQLGPNWLLPLVEGVLLVALIGTTRARSSARSGRSASGWSPYWF